MYLRRSRERTGGVEGIRTPDGEMISTDREGTLDAGYSQAQKAAERGTTGAALGATIGAVAGGGKGAAIAAVIGAGGARAPSSSALENRQALQRGTEFTIMSAGPWSRRLITRA